VYARVRSVKAVVVHVMQLTILFLGLSVLEPSPDPTRRIRTCGFDLNGKSCLPFRAWMGRRSRFLKIAGMTTTAVATRIHPTMVSASASASVAGHLTQSLSYPFSRSHQVLLQMLFHFDVYYWSACIPAISMSAAVTVAFSNAVRAERSALGRR